MNSADISFELIYVCLRLYDNRNSWHNRVGTECMMLKFAIHLLKILKLSFSSRKHK